MQECVDALGKADFPHAYLGFWFEASPSRPHLVRKAEPDFQSKAGRGVVES